MISFVEFHSYVKKAIIAVKQSLWYAKKKPQHACASCKQIVQITGSVFLQEMENRYFGVFMVVDHLKSIFGVKMPYFSPNFMLTSASENNLTRNDLTFL